MNSFTCITRACAAAALLILSACGGGGGGDSFQGTARDFERQDSAVTVTPNVGVPTTYTATQVITISNDDAGASRVVSHWQNTSGSIVSSPASTAGYQVQVTLTATAPSEEQARAALATMHIAHRDATGGNTLYLDHEITFGSYSENQVSRSAAVAASLPPAAEHDLAQHITSGSNSTSGLAGPQATITGTSGNQALSGAWDSGTVDATSGNITVSGDIADLTVSTTSGTVTATVPGMRGTQATFGTTSGTVDVTVVQAVGAGYDLEARATTGTTSIVVAGTSPVGEQTAGHKHYRSPGFADSNPKVDISAIGTSGSLSIHD